MNNVRITTDAVRRRTAILTAAALALLVAFVMAPDRLAAGRLSGGLVDRGHVVAAVHAGFVDYWRSGDRRFPPDLANVVDYWLRFHAVKAIIAAALLWVLVSLGVGLWRAFATVAGTGRKLGVASAGVVVGAFGLLSALAVMANLQGVAAPFSSLLPMLWDGRTDSGVRDASSQVRQQLAAGHGTVPPLGAMIDDFGRYHAVMAVIAAAVAAMLIALTVVWVRATGRHPSGSRAKRALRLMSGAGALFALAMIVLAVANAGTAMDPAPALLGLFEGGW